MLLANYVGKILHMSVAVITGANRGLGLALTRSYLDDGWRVIAMIRSGSAELDTLAKEYPLTILETELTNDTSLARSVAQIDDAKVDLLINCAGTMGNATFGSEGFACQEFGAFDRAEWLHVFDLNVCTPQALTELLIDKLEAADGGIVVTLSSMLGSNALNTAGSIYAYRASKAAVNSIMKSMGINLAERGVTAIALHPGWVRTDMGGPDADISVEESIAGIRKVIAGLTLADAGRFLAWDGREMPY